MTFGLQLNDYVEMILSYNVANQRCLNVFHYQVTAPLTGTVSVDPEEICDSFNDNVWSVTGGHGLDTLMSTNTTDATISCQRLTRDRTRLVYIDATPGAGTRIAAALPPSNAIVLKRGTDLAGPEQNGRIFLGGVPADLVDDGELNGTGLPAALDKALVLANNLGAASTPTLVLRPALFTSTGINELNRFITVTGADTPIRVQRRREVGRGQ